MKELPQLNKLELTQWKEKILGERSNKFPDAFFLEQLFDERSVLSKASMLSERIEGLIRKMPPAKTSNEMKAMWPKILSYLQDEGYIDEKLYEEETEKCSQLIIGRDY